MKGVAVFSIAVNGLLGWDLYATQKRLEDQTILASTDKTMRKLIDACNIVTYPCNPNPEDQTQVVTKYEIDEIDREFGFYGPAEKVYDSYYNRYAFHLARIYPTVNIVYWTTCEETAPCGMTGPEFSCKTTFTVSNKKQ